MRLIILLLASFFTFSCTKKDEVNNEHFQGKYKGQFTRGGDTANVEIEFKDGLFTGTSDKSFPSICAGQVLQQKDVVFFSNGCGQSSSVDVLSGNYFYYLKDNYLSLWKTTNGVTGYYKLNK